MQAAGLRRLAASREQNLGGGRMLYSLRGLPWQGKRVSQLPEHCSRLATVYHSDS